MAARRVDADDRHSAGRHQQREDAGPAAEVRDVSGSELVGALEVDR